MYAWELEQLSRHPDWRATLKAYAELAAQTPKLAVSQQPRATESQPQTVPADGWLPRLMVIPGVRADRTSAVHGRLIAFGFLKFELCSRDSEGRDTGLRYQLTPMARSVLSSGNEVITDDSSHEEEPQAEPQHAAA